MVRPYQIIWFETVTLSFSSFWLCHPFKALPKVVSSKLSVAFASFKRRPTSPVARCVGSLGAEARQAVLVLSATTVAASSFAVG